MREKLGRLWLVFKLLIAALILVLVGLRFKNDLERPELDWGRWLRHPLWLITAGLLYLLGYSWFAIYWRRLLHGVGQNPSVGECIRAYFVGQLGKYVPGKAWALVMRASLIGAVGVPLGSAAMTGFYENLVTLATGALLAVIFFAALGPSAASEIDFDLPWRVIRLKAEEREIIDRNTSVILSLGLLIPLLMPILPPVFNRLVQHVSLPFRAKNTEAPTISWFAFFQGIGLTACGWLFLTASLAAVLYAGGGIEVAVGPNFYSFLGRLTAIMGLSFAAGFLVLLAPGGLGVREFVLVLFLTPELKTLLLIHHDDARALAVQAVIVLRLVSTAADLLMAVICSGGHSSLSCKGA